MPAHVNIHQFSRIDGVPKPMLDKSVQPRHLVKVLDRLLQ